MKYIKYFENSDYNDFKKYKEEIISTLSLYCKLYSRDVFFEKIEYIVDNFDNASHRYDQIGKIDEECIRMVIENIEAAGVNSYDINELLELFYDCNTIIERDKSKQLLDKLSDIFAEYSDEGKVEIKIASDYDNGYSIEIRLKDIITNISFTEIIQRSKEIGLDKISYSGKRDSIKIVLYSGNHISPHSGLACLKL